MNKLLLTKKLSILDAITVIEGQIDNITKKLTIGDLLQFAEHDELKIYFNVDITGYAINKQTATGLNSDGSLGRAEVNSDISQISRIDGDIKFLEGHCTDESIELGRIFVTKFKQNDTEYYTTKELGQVLRSSLHKIDDLFIYRESILDFINNFLNGTPTSTESESKFDGADYLNPDHKNYSSELHAAIEAWKYANADQHKYHSFKKKIESYLKDCKFSISSEAKKRISVVVNANINKRNKKK